MLQVKPGSSAVLNCHPVHAKLPLARSSVTTTQLMRKDLGSVLASTFHEKAPSWWIAHASCVVAIAIGCANRVMQVIVVSLLSVNFSYPFDVTLLKNAIKS